MAGIPFNSVPALPFRAPRGKLPFMSHEKKCIPDSGQIIAYLQQRYGDPLDQELNAEQRALGHLIRRCCEESLYFVLLYHRWIDPDGWKIIKPTFFGTMPFLLRDVVASLARRGVRRALHDQGYGRHTPEEVLALGEADLWALALMLATRDFVVADHPTSYDATLYAFLANILRAPLNDGLKERVLQHANLVAYVDRMELLLGRT